MENRPNFFSLLELDPSINKWSIIELAILDKRRTWSMQKNQGTPTQRRKAERYLKYIPEMESLLKNPESLKQEAKQYKKELAKNQKINLNQLDELIKTIQTTTVSPKLIQKLISQTGKVFTQSEVEKRLKERGISVAENKERKKNSKPKMERSIATGIRKQLDILKLKNLYTFLNLNSTSRLNKRSSPKSLYERADSIYKDLSRTGKTDSDTTLKMELAGHAKSVFSDQNKKQRYDNSYELEALLELNKYIEIAEHNKFIGSKELASLLVTGKKMGIHEEAVLEYIEEITEKRKWVLQKESTSTQEKYQICGYCDTLSSPQDKHCIKCGEKLIEQCQKCGNLTPTEYESCNKCGFHTGDAPLVKSLFNDAKRYVNEGDFDKAINYLNRALDYWHDWEPAKDQINLIKEQQNTAYKALNDINKLISQRNFEAADLKLKQYHNQFGQANTIHISKKINEELTKAKVVFNLAEKFHTTKKFDLAFDKYAESLTFCADFSLAIAAMAKTPPPSPIKIVVKWIGTTLRLSWQAVKTQGEFSYKIIRKEQGAPSHIEDGKVIMQTTAEYSDDINIKSGTVYYYAVFTIRANTASRSCAISGPHLLMADVSNVKYQVGDKRVTINWDSPFGSLGTEIWKQKISNPVSKKEQKNVISNDSFIDSELKNGSCYQYFIIAKYPDPANTTKIRYSNGVEITVTPTSPPMPINDLRCQRRDDAIFLSWTPLPENVSIQIRQTQMLPAMSIGQIISLNEVAKFGTPISISTNKTAQTTLQIQGRVYFIPLSIISETVVLGKPVSITTLDDISQLASRKNGNSIYLTWNWPIGAKEVLITYLHDRFPSQPSEIGAVKISITQDEYKNNHCWELRSAIEKKHYFTLFVKDPSAYVYSQGHHLIETMGQETTVQYKVMIDRHLFSRKIKSAYIEFKSNINSLDKLLVVMNQNFPPISKDDGIVIVNQPQLPFIDGIAKIIIPSTSLKTQGYIKVFFENNQDLEEIRLLPSKIENLKLG